MKRTIVLVMVTLACLGMVAALASAQSMPWEKPLTDISTSMIGPVAAAGFLIALAAFCLMWMMGYAAVGVAVGVVVAGAILGNADTVASWLGL
jgi:type IV secretory pathway VirB2 component (pilin)